MKQFHPLLKGAFELHCHSYPSIFPRKQTDWMLVEDVDEAGMAGVLLKSHEAPTADRATLIRDKYPHLHVYGGLACNYFTGGLSPPAVDVAIRSGAKIIWMPTFSSKVHQAHFAQKKTPFFSNERPLTHPAQGLEVWDDKHRIKAEVHEILSLIGNADIILATGHISPAEVAALVDAALDHKVQKILIQHPDLGIAKIPFEMEVELVRKGAFLEKCYLACSKDFKDLTPEEMAASIQKLGSKSCVMVTDYGQLHNIPPIQALSEFIEDMLRYGISEDDIEQMICTNPKHLLNL